MTKQFMSGLSVTDAFGFFSQVWGQGVASQLGPMTANVKEIDQRLANLKIVEQWLTVNLNMLQATIHGVEMHRATVETFQSFGADFSGLSQDFSMAKKFNQVPVDCFTANDNQNLSQQVAQEWALLGAANFSKMCVDNASAWLSMVTAQFDKAPMGNQNPNTDSVNQSSGQSDLSGQALSDQNTTQTQTNGDLIYSESSSEFMDELTPIEDSTK